MNTLSCCSIFRRLRFMHSEHVLPPVVLLHNTARCSPKAMHQQLTFRRDDGDLPVPESTKDFICAKERLKYCEVDLKHSSCHASLLNAEFISECLRTKLLVMA
eukprot:gnl/TRDRNA2_/TRDRNA2_160485_c0_seq1.p1 gnl/TRDRNA2_/TRDRNA2_160485_c0~~gnl/TRDRNA2_/TRDRNA2_160485_c0_seq1.p1  ORF type:complete len:103 (+),score=16.51 gnl/TRDRNA2_/TRDRNA2_160485_c0_seq1:218-526(+)